MTKKRLIFDREYFDVFMLQFTQLLQFISHCSLKGHFLICLFFKKIWMNALTKSVKLIVTYNIDNQPYKRQFIIFRFNFKFDMTTDFMQRLGRNWMLEVNEQLRIIKDSSWVPVNIGTWIQRIPLGFLFSFRFSQVLLYLLVSYATKTMISLDSCPHQFVSSKQFYY